MDEKEIVLGEVPFNDIDSMNGSENNAYVYKDSFGRLSILINGMWLGVDLKYVQGDQAPFCG